MCTAAVSGPRGVAKLLKYIDWFPRKLTMYYPRARVIYNEFKKISIEAAVAEKKCQVQVGVNF